MNTLEKATFAAGCFWGVENLFAKNFQVETKVGYIGGKTKNPTYREVTYASLVKFFYQFHDPTTLNRQGNDIGTQYRSAIFYHSEEQRKIAEEVTNKVQENLSKGKILGDKGKRAYEGDKIVTQIVEAGEFYDAEDMHQKYL
ncbi:9609_t:CDS:2, partial [Acaulospora colombiana]